MVLKEWLNEFYSIIDRTAEPAMQKAASEPCFTFNNLGDFLIATGIIAGVGLFAAHGYYKKTNNCDNMTAVKGLYEEAVVSVHELQKYIPNIF